ncbi:protein spaetzle-like isoform X2 [Hermetia illucens]|uniref:protein spaetzle-like isoform X2 n=1 Tax=Hermetia illucens TaxID=343691 RepID=UPI0018CBF954|nr:protein spaetzle-like isoform X2 [Hermetia illucens]
MLLVMVNMIYLTAALVFTSVSPSLATAEPKGDLTAVESFIDDEKPALLSQALYVALPKESRGQYQGHIDPPTVLPVIDDTQIFKVQRNPDGKLSVVYNNTPVIPPDSENGQDNGAASIDTTQNHSQTTRDVDLPAEGQIESLSGIRPICNENNKHFCTYVENYPTELLQSYLETQQNKFEEIFGDDLVPPPSINLTQRIDAPGEEPMCASVERLIYPQAGFTRDNSWSIIVNQPNYTQGVRVEECVNAGSSCAMADSFPIGYRTQCKQKYIFRRLLALTPEGRVTRDLFKLPSCCKCVVSTGGRRRRAPDGK